MYENGRKLNRYARKQLHIRNLKRRSTPLEFNSYEQYVVDKMSRYEDGDWKYWEEYWQGHSLGISPGWKKDLKHMDHCKERARYGTKLRGLHNDPEAEVLLIRGRMEDRWWYY